MPCYHPLTALQPTGGGPLLFPQREHLYLYNDYRTLDIPCGQCHGCRLERSRDWATRCMHEAQTHKYNSFITLTYNNDNLPENNNLIYRDFQLFMKRLRKALGKEVPIMPDSTHIPAILHSRHGDSPHTPGHTIFKVTPQLKFYMAGEYGDQFGRPHYHACLFGVDFSDKVYHRQTQAGSKIYTSKTLDKLWKLGYTSIGDVTFESAAYIARYIMSKQTGDGDKNNYNIIDLETGEIITQKKEFNNMSRRQGIGKTWLKRYTADVYTTGKVIVRGHASNPPKYYDRIFKDIDRLAFEGLQYARLVEAMSRAADNTDERLAVKEQVSLAKTSQLKRKLQ